MEKYFLFLTLAFIAEILGTISGFGSSILFVPIASMFFDFKMVLGITVVFHIFSNLSKIVLFKKGINKSIVLRLGIPAVVFVIIGAVLTTRINTDLITLLMNMVVVFIAMYLILNFNKPIRQSSTNLYIGGALSGFTAGIAGTGGAIRGITLAAFQLPKDMFIATSAFIDLGVDFSRAIVYISNSYFEKKYIMLIPFLMGISFLGSYMGKKILNKTSEIYFRYIVLLVVLITACFQLGKMFFDFNHFVEKM